MLRIVPQAITPDNEKYHRAVADARAALECAVALTVTADASFAAREEAVLRVANETCRLLLEAALQTTATAQPARLRVEGLEYQRHHAGTVTYHSLCVHWRSVGRRIARWASGTVRRSYRWSWRPA